jgi:hypothetical protein
MVVDIAAPPIGRAVPKPLVLVAIPVGLALLGLLLRFAVYMQVGWDPKPHMFADGICRWDCEWYVNIATNGYDPYPVPGMIDAGNWAFFPLYPLIVGVLHRLSAVPVMVIATAVSILFSGLAAVIAWPLLEKNLKAYTLYCAFLLCGPVSIYFTTFYTEVLFVLLSNCLFLALKRTNYIAAGASAALLSATRIVGVFAVIAIVVQFISDRLGQGEKWRTLPMAALKSPELILAVFVAPLGLFAYMAYLHFYIGDALAFSHVQRAWGRVSGNPLVYWWQALTEMPQEGIWPSISQQLGLAALVALGLSLVLIWRRQYSAAVFCLICLIVPMAAGMASMLRFVSAMSPLVLTLMLFLARWRIVFLATLAGFVAADYFFTFGWLQGYLTLV